MSRSLGGTSLRYALARGLPGLINFAALATFTRLLGEREYGQYALVVALAALAYALCLQWLSLAALRLLHAPGHTREVFLATILRLFTRIAVPVAVGLALVPPLVVPGLSFLLSAGGGLLFVALAWFDLNLCCATADQEPARYGRLSVARSVIGLGTGCLVLALGAGPAGLVGAVALGYGLGGAFAIPSTWRGTRLAAADPALRGTLFAYGLPLVASYVLEYVVSSSDRLLLGLLQGTAAAGLYSPAYDLCQQSLVALVMIVNLAAYPMSVRAFESGDTAQQATMFRRHFFLLLAVLLPSAVGLAVLGPSVSQVLGARFAAAAVPLLPVIAAAVFLFGLKSSYFDLSFQLSRSTRGQLVSMVVGAGVNLALNLWWIPLAGLQGAAYATLVGYAAALGTSIWLGRRCLRLPVVPRDVLRIAAAAGLMGLVLWQLRGWTGPVALAAQVVTGAAVYGAALWGGSRQVVREVLTA